LKDFGQAECETCGAIFTKQRAAQSYCCERHRNLATQRRKRRNDMDRSGDINYPLPSYPEAVTPPSVTLPTPLPPYQWPDAPSDDLGKYEVDYPIEYWPCGMPKIPDCLRRKPIELDEAA
jgi:hypothetical protein